MAREMDSLAREKEQQIAKLVAQYGSVEAVLAAIAKKKELAERNIERKAEYQSFSPKSIGESMPAKPATTAQKLALFQQANPSALLSPRDSIKDQMTTTGVPNKEERALQYKEFSDDAALLGGLDEGEGGDPRVVEQAIGRREDLGTEALPVVQAMERGQRTEKEAEKRRLELGMRKQDFMTGADREEYGVTPMVKGEPTAGGLGELPPSVRAKFQAPGSGGEVDKERVASMYQGDIEQQMVEGMAQDQKVLKPGDVTTEEDERAVNEEFMMNASEEEQEEVIAQVISATGPNSEATATVKEDTGRYVRYDGATKKGITLSKSRLQQLYDRKGKMALLQHVPQENRAALLFNWDLISEKDFNDTQKQSTKELLELEKIGLQVAELKNKTGKMSDAQKAQVTAASTGLAAAVKDRRWDEVEAFQTQLNALMPDRKPLDIAKIQEGIDKKLKALPALDRAKAQMGTQVWDGYFSFKNDLVKKVDLLKRSTAGSGDLAKFLGAPITEGENAGKTWSDVLESQGFGSWTNIQKLKRDSPDGKRIALKLTGGKNDDITQITRSFYMGKILPQLKNRIMENNYGKWHTMIEGGLKNAQAGETKKHQDKINNNPADTDPGRQDPAPPEAVVEPESNLPPRPKRQRGRGVPTIEEEPVPEANPEEIQKIKERKALEEAEAESFPEAINRLFIKSDPAQLEKIKKYHKENKPKSKTARKGYDNFLNFSVKQLEDAKGNKTVLEKLLKEHKKNQNKKVRANPPEDHTFEDYNIEYILSLLNR
tara:strand:+ start:237 stop:2552 length:2316 start_codon:yes stop_codon:yes gene_type:complete